MLRNNNGSSSYIKVRANKNLSIQNSGSSSSGSNYKENSSINQNKSVSVSSSRSTDNNSKNKYLQNNQFQTIQEDNFNHLNRNIDFSSINLKNQMNLNRNTYNPPAYSQENKENVNINYSNYISNYHQLGQQQETFRKINQSKDEKVIQNSQNQQQQKSTSQQSARQKQNTSQPKNLYQSIISNNINQAFKKNKGVIPQQRQSLDLSNKNEVVEVQKKRSESTYSNYSFDSNANNQSICVMGSTNLASSHNNNSIQLNNWLQNNQLISLENMRQAPDSNCINISHLLNQNVSQNNISVIESSSNLTSISPVGGAQNRNQSKSPLPFNQMIQNNTQNAINDPQNQLISRQFNSVQNSKNNPHQIQQLNQKQFSSQNNNNFTKQNSNQKLPHKIQIVPDSSHQLHTFTSSENNNNGEMSSNNNFNISQDRLYSQSNPSTSHTIESLTLIQKQNELNQIKKDLRSSNNELISYKNKLKAMEQENKHLKQQMEQDKQQKLHLEEYIQKIKGLQFVIAQEKRISSRIVYENLQRNENVSLILTNLVNIIQIIQQKIVSPKVSYEKILQQISENLTPILLCLNPIIQDINTYNQTIINQLQNQHESRIEPNMQLLNKQVSQKGKKVLTIKGAQQEQQQQQQVVQRNNSNNKLNNNQQIKKRGISVEEPPNPFKQKKQQPNQSSNTLGRSHSSMNVKQQQQQQQQYNQQQQKIIPGLADDQFDQLQQGSQHLLKQSLSSINLQTQSLHIPQLDEQNENEIEAIITKQLLNNNNNPLQQIQLKHQQQQDQKHPIKQQANRIKQTNNQQISLNECQRINTKESVDSFYQQCLLNNSLRISESSRSINASNVNNQFNTMDNPSMSQNSQIMNNNNQLNANLQKIQNDKEILSDNYPLQTGSIFGQLTQCSSSLGGMNNNGKLPSARGQFFDSQFSQLDNYNSNHVNRNSNESHRNQIIPQTSQEFTGCFSTLQNQNCLVGTFSQIPVEGGAKINIDSNYNSQTDQYSHDMIQGRRNSNHNNIFKMSNYNSGSSQYNQSQKLFGETLKGLGETLKNLQQEDSQRDYSSDLNSQKQDIQPKSKSTFRSNADDFADQQPYQYQQLSLIKQEQENEDIISINDKLNQIGTEKSSTQLEIENLKKKIMQRQSRRKLQSCHNSSVQEISHNENSQRDMSAPPKDSQLNI